MSDTDLSELTPDIVEATDLVEAIERQLDDDDNLLVMAQAEGKDAVAADILHEETDLEALEDSILDAAAGVSREPDWCDD